MKNKILNLGKVLNKEAQKSINGGFFTPGCVFYDDPYGGTCSACCKVVGIGICEPDPTQMCMP